MRVDLFKGDGRVRTIYSRTANDGSHRWAVEAYATGNIYYLFEICDADIEQCRARAGVRIAGDLRRRQFEFQNPVTACA